MLVTLRNKIYHLLRWSERYTRTDMVYMAKGGFWLTVGKFFVLADSLLLSIVFANFLPKEVFGTYKYILSIATLLLITTLDGISTSITQAVAAGYGGSLYSAAKTRTRWGILGMLIGFVVAGYYLYNGDVRLAELVAMVAIFVPFYNSFAVYANFLHGKKNYKKMTQINILISVVTTITLAVIVFLSGNVFLVIAGYFVPKIIIHAYYLIQISAEYGKDQKEKNDFEMVKFGKYLSYLGMLVTLAAEMDKVLIWHYLGAVEVAVYAMANIPVQHVNSLFKTNVSTLAFPKLSEKSIETLQQTLPQKILRLYLLIIPAIIGYILLVPWVFSYIYPQYHDSIPFTRLFIFTILFMPIGLLSSALIAHKKIKEITIMRFFTPSLRIILLLSLVPIYGIYGVIWSQLIAGTLQSLLIIFLFYKMKA